MYLFDTDILSNIVKQKSSDILIQKLLKTPKELQFTSAININEIYYGANRSLRKDRISKAFDMYVFPNVNVLPFDEECGRVFGELKANLERNGIGCSEPDLRIASITIQYDLTLVIGNTKHFKNIPGLKIENWISR